VGQSGVARNSLRVFAKTRPPASFSPFKWRHFEGQIILLCVRWYLRYCLSYRDLEEIMAERGLKVDHTTIYRWVQRYAPELEKRCKPHLKQTNGSWRVDETYIKVKGKWLYLYRAVDSAGNTLEFLLNQTRDTQAAKLFLARALDASHTTTPRVINVDRNPAYPKAVGELKAEGQLPEGCQLRPRKRNDQELTDLLDRLQKLKDIAPTLNDSVAQASLLNSIAETERRIAEVAGAVGSESALLSSQSLRTP
jgi:transposase-like protein